MKWFRFRGAALALVAAASWPAHILAVNVVGIVRPERVLGIVVFVWIFGVILLRLLVSFGVGVTAAENAVFVALLLAMNGGPIERRLGVLAYVILLVCPVIVGWLSMRFKGSMVIAALAWGSAVAIASGPVLALVENWPESSGPSVVEETDPLDVRLSDTPDIFLVVLDGYPGAIAAEQDDLSVGTVNVRADLAARGFDVPSSTWSSYWATNLSVPSLLEMDYPVRTAGWRGYESKSDLQAIVSGDNEVVGILEKNGYQTHMIESGWSGASCEDRYDHCVPSPLIDEATHLILTRTVAWPLISESPGPYVLGTLAAFEWLFDHGPILSASSTPDFVFMHVVSPHPPLLLRPDCSAQYVPERAGGGFNLEGVDPEDRESFLVDQVDCVDRLMLRLADSLDPEDILIFVSDHGTDRRYQANPATVDWDRETTIERLNNFLAGRLPNGCDFGDEIIVPNVLRTVLGCISSSTVNPLPERMWVNPMVEVDQEIVDSLMSMRPDQGRNVSVVP